MTYAFHCRCGLSITQPPTLTPLQTTMLVRLHIAAGPVPDDEWTSDEWRELRDLSDARLIEHHYGIATITPKGAAVAQRAIDALAAWDAVHKHLLQVYPRPHGCTILPTGNPVPAPDWMVYTHAAPTKGAIGNHTDPMRAVLIAKATLEGYGND